MLRLWRLLILKLINVIRKSKTKAKINGQTGVITNCETDAMTNGQTDVTTNGETDVTTNGQTDVTTNGQTDVTTNGQTDLTTYGKTDVITNCETDATNNSLTGVTTNGETNATTNDVTDVTSNSLSDYERNTFSNSGASSARASQNPLEVGIVKSFSRSKGHGFISPEKGGDAIFVHVSDIEGEYVPLPGDEVRYRLCPIPPKFEKYQAVHVEIIHLIPEVHLRWDTPSNDCIDNNICEPKI